VNAPYLNESQLSAPSADQSFQADFTPSAERLRSFGGLLPLILTLFTLAVGSIVGLLLDDEGWWLGPAGAVGMSVIANLAHAFWPSIGARKATVTLRRGGLDVRYSLMGRTILDKIDASHVTGASVSGRKGAYIIHVQMVGRAKPDAIVVETVEQVDTVMQAIGIHHHGSGTLQWPKHSDGKVIAAIATTVLGLNTCGFASVVLTLATGIRSLMKPRLDFPAVALRSDGVHIPGTVIPYAAITHAAAYGKSLNVYGTAGIIFSAKVGVRPAEVQLIVDQILSASRRARGEAVQRESVAERVVQLSRQNGESARDWIARVDAMATGAMYRGMGVETRELWEVASNASEPFGARIAAARALTKIEGDEAKVRIEGALANVHAPEERIRVAVFADADQAAEVIDTVGQALR
jgi:hypothetical protein